MPLDQKQYPAVIEPTQDVTSLQQSISRLNEIVGMLTGQRGGAEWSLAAGLRTLERQSATGFSRILELTELEDNLASRTDIVEVRANNATANGTIQIKALTTPLGGATATYQWQLTANDHSIGMQASVDGLGNGSISFTANQFSLYDPGLNSGTPTAVFNYTGGIFTFNVPVVVRNQDIQINAVSNSGFNEGSGTSPTASVVLTLRTSSRVMIQAAFTPASGHAQSAAVDGNVNIKIDGTKFKGTQFNYRLNSATTSTSTAVGNWNLANMQYVPTSAESLWFTDALSAGPHTFLADTSATHTVTGTISLIVTVLDR